MRILGPNILENKQIESNVGAKIAIYKIVSAYALTKYGNKVIDNVPNFCEMRDHAKSLFWAMSTGLLAPYTGIY